MSQSASQFVNRFETPRTTEYAGAVCPQLTAFKGICGRKIEFHKSCVVYITCSFDSIISVVNVCRR